MTDLILVSSNTKEFHAENLKWNWSHYSTKAKILPLFVTDAVNRMFTKTYFNPFVTLSDGNEYKYGIVHIDDFKNDLRKYQPFFNAAWLQKPVLSLMEPPDDI